MKTCLFVIFVLLHDVHSKVLPDFIPQCKRKDPDLTKCVLAAIDKVKPHLNEGIPEIRVPAAEPLEIPKLTIDRNLEALRVKAILKNIKVFGTTSFKIKNIKIDLNKLSAELSISIPRIKVTTTYDVNGRLLLIPLAGKGNMEGNFTDITAIAKASAKLKDKKGNQYLEVDKLNTKIKVGNGHVKFIDNGPNTLIAETAAGFFNGNPRLVLDIINPIVEDTSDAIFKTLTNRMFSAIPYSELLPED